MNKYPLFVISLLFIALSTSCKRKKYTEVVDVPLPTYEEKLTMGLPEDVSADEGAFDLVALPYKYDAIIPVIDVLTMETHYSKHYLGYTNGLNRALADTEQESSSIEDLLKSLDMNNTELRNNMGGYFKTQFISTANTLVGSGWVWLVVDNAGKLQITTTQNQDNPLMPRATVAGKPILALDLWEHAYYLDYQYRRKKYIDNYFNIINWNKVNEKFEDASTN